MMPTGRSIPWGYLRGTLPRIVFSRKVDHGVAKGNMGTTRFTVLLWTLSTPTAAPSRPPPFTSRFPPTEAQPVISFASTLWTFAHPLPGETGLEAPDRRVLDEGGAATFPAEPWMPPRVKSERYIESSRSFA